MTDTPNRLDPLQKSMIEDFHKVLSNSKQLHEFWHILLEDERNAVEDSYLQLIWQIIFAAATAKDTEGMDQEDIKAYYKQFGGFVLECQRGLPSRFFTAHWVAMDRHQFAALTGTNYPERPKEGDPSVGKSQTN